MLQRDGNKRVLMTTLSVRRRVVCSIILIDRHIQTTAIDYLQCNSYRLTQIPTGAFCPDPRLDKARTLTAIVARHSIKLHCHTDNG